MKLQDPNTSVVATFKTLSVLNDGKSTKAGRPIYDDQDVVEIRLPGNKQTVGVFPAHEVCGWTKGPDGSQTQETYAMRYNPQYLAFKNGEGQVQNGTPLEALDFLTPGKRLELKALNIYTAEALAGLDSAALKRIGMGGREWKDKAAAYLETASEHRIEDRMAGVVESQDARIAELEAQIASLQSAHPLDHDANGKKGGAKKPTQIEPAPAEDTPTLADVIALAETAHFKTFKAAAAKVLGDDTPSTKDEIVAALEAKQQAETPSPFADFEEADLRNWLQDAVPGLDTSGFDHAALIVAADEANAKLAEKQKV